MAFRINGIDVITNERSLDDVNKAGITTALLVGPEGAETFKVDGVTGIATAAKFVFSGDETKQIDALITDIGLAGASNSNIPSALAVKEYVDAGISADGELELNDLSLGGTLSVTGTSTLSGAITAGGSFQFGENGQTVTAVGVSSALTQDGSAASDSVIPTEKAVKEYVDGQLDNNTSLEFSDGSESSSIDLNDETLSFIGTEKELTVAVTDNTVTFSLPDDVTIGNNLTVTGDFAFDGGGQVINTVGVSTFLIQDGTAASNSVLPTEKAVKTYVDNQIGSNNQLMFLDDDATEGLIDLKNEKLTFSGTENQIETTVDASEGNKVTFNLANDTKITSSLVVGEDLGANGPGSDILTASITAGGTEETPAPGVAINGDLNVSGNVDSASDRKLKENIEVIPNALEKVAALRGVEYTWKSNGNYSAGIIAQEVQAVMPGLVTDNETHLSVQYNGLIGLLIEGMKEQQAQIEELKSRLA